jgi:hypothetical protein
MIIYKLKQQTIIPKNKDLIEKTEKDVIINIINAFGEM